MMKFKNSTLVRKILTTAATSAAVGVSALVTTPAQAMPTDYSPCTSDAISITQGQADVGAGVTRVLLTFTNITSDECAIVGSPTIQAVAVGAGIHPIGPAAEPREEAMSTLTVLKAGESATATLTDLNGAKIGLVVNVDELRITLPSGGNPIVLPYDGLGATDRVWMKIDALHAT